MSFISVKNSLYIIAFSVGLQIVLVGIDWYFHHQYEQLEERQMQFSRVEHKLFTILALEKEVMHRAVPKDDLLIHYHEMMAANEAEKLGLDQQLLSDRSKINSTLSRSWDERRQLYDKLNNLLPALTLSVTYIHEHHIAYLKNLLHHGELDEGYETPVSFSRKDASAGSELDIVSVAINIQSIMLEIMEQFSRLQRGFSPASIHASFKKAITQFYNATNTFEDYSLDAQDGLLVEELLLTGTTLEKSFDLFLQLESSILEINKQLEQNRIALLDNFAAVKELNNIENMEFNRIVKTNKFISLGINFLILMVLLFITRKMFLALDKVVGETRKIECDHTYRIPQQRNDFKEFTYIFNALNLMGQTISKKLDELVQFQKVLEERVAARTMELSQVNLQLSEKIEEKEKNEKERRELQERLNRAEKMEAVGTLAGGVAHDLNNILSGIVSYPELLLMKIPKEHSLRRPLETIKSAGEKAAVIVDDLLTMTRRGVVKQEPVSLNQLIEIFLTSHELSNILVHNHKIVVENHLDASKDIILGSSVHLQKTLVNLTSNAAESISSSGIIRISTTNVNIDTEVHGYDQVNQGEYIKFSISDSGAGIPKENIERIFEPFFTTKTMGRSGSGLGMAVVWGTVKDHNGYINLVSEVNTGTTFDLYFPLLNEAKMSPPEHNNLANLSAQGEKVLVVDDVKEQREIAQHMLKQLGYEVQTAESGEEAISYLKTNRVDILLLDMIMQPGMDGLDTYRTILEFLPQQKAIIASGFSENDKVREVQRIGAGAYIKKPYSIYEIARILRSELDELIT